MYTHIKSHLENTVVGKEREKKTTVCFLIELTFLFGEKPMNLQSLPF